MFSLIAKVWVATLPTIPSQQRTDALLRPTRSRQQKAKSSSSQKKEPTLLRTPSSRGAEKLVKAVPHGQLYKISPVGSRTGPLLTLRLLEQGSSTALLGRALLANLRGRASPCGLSQCSIIPRQIIWFVRNGYSGTRAGSALAR